MLSFPRPLLLFVESCFGFLLYLWGMPSDGFERLVMAVSESLPIGVVLAVAMKILVTAHLADITTRRSVQEQRNLGFSLESSSSSIV